LSHAPAPTPISPLSLHDALPICLAVRDDGPLDERVGLVQLSRVHTRQLEIRLGGLDQVLHLAVVSGGAMTDAESHLDIIKQGHQDRKSTRLNSSHVKISYAVFCL